MPNTEFSLSASRWAPGHTLAGNLQRGTGRGYLQALAAPRITSSELLLACIRDDPRWDRQLDCRGSYYASLFLVFRLEVGLLVEQLRALDGDPDEASRWLPLEVLGALSCRGVSSATRALCDYLHWGAAWSVALSALAERDAGNWQGLDQVVCARCPDDDELTWEVSEGQPWLGWSETNPRIAAALERSRARQHAVHLAQSADRFAHLTLRELFQQISHENWVAIRRAMRPRLTPQDLPLLATFLDPVQPWHCKLALSGLGWLGGPDAFSLWKQFVEAHPHLPPFVRTTSWLAARGFDLPVAQGIGQEWFLSEDPRLRSLGAQLLAHSATTEVLPVLREAVAPALESLDLYRLSSIAEGLERIGSPEAWSELALAFHESPYSYGRYHVAKAMVAAAPDCFATEIAGDALWDCEPNVREASCEAVNPSWPRLKRRQEELASDLQEDADIRGAASRHLAVAEQTRADADL